MEYLKNALNKFADFETRASRKEYWMFVLWFILVYFGLFIISAILSKLVRINIVFLPIIFAIVYIIPSISIAVRRLHDIGKSGWWYFISFIPFVGGIWLLVLLVTKGDIGNNSYGPSPIESVIPKEAPNPTNTDSQEIKTESNTTTAEIIHDTENSQA